MIDPKTTLLWTTLADLADAVERDPSGWTRAREACAAFGEADPDVAAALDARDAAALRSIVAGWRDGGRLLPACDRMLLKRALKAFRRTLKLSRLDEESKLGGRGMSRGERSGVVGVRPPPAFAAPIWAELARQGRLVASDGGTYELPPE